METGRRIAHPAVIGNSGIFLKDPMVSGRAASLCRRRFRRRCLTRSRRAARSWRRVADRQVRQEGEEVERVGGNPKQARVLANNGCGTGTEALAFATEDEVRQRYGATPKPVFI